MKKLCMEKKVFPEAEAEILCFGRVREEKFPTRRQGLQSCGVRVIVRVLKKAAQTIQNDENTVRHRQHDL